MMNRILPLLALLPIAACATTEAGLDRPTPQAPAVTEATIPAARPADLPIAAPAPSVLTTPIPAAAPAPARPAAGNLSPPPAAEGIAAGEPNPAAPTPPTPVSAAPTGRLGTTVASLGTTSPGLWLETPLVSAPSQGRIEYNGQSVSVQLRPSGGEPGSGSQISVEAMRALGAPLTGLPEITVYGG